MRIDPLQLPPSFSLENRLTELRAHMKKHRRRIRRPSSTSAVNPQADALRPVSVVADRPLQGSMVISQPMHRQPSQSTRQLKLFHPTLPVRQWQMKELPVADHAHLESESKMRRMKGLPVTDHADLESESEMKDVAEAVRHRADIALVLHTDIVILGPLIPMMIAITMNVITMTAIATGREEIAVGWSSEYLVDAVVTVLRHEIVSQRDSPPQLVVQVRLV